MATLYTHQAENVRRTWFLMTFFLGVVIAIGFVFAQIYGNPNILYGFFAFSIVMNIVAYWKSDKIAIAQAGAVLANEAQYRELHNIVENLAITAGLPKPKVYIINDPAPNAFATGRNKDHAAIAVTTGILQILNKTELEGVIAHELSHIGNRDILVSTVAVVLAGFISIAANVFMRYVRAGGCGGFGLFCLCILFAITSTMMLLSNWWLGRWSNAERVRYGSTNTTHLCSSVQQSSIKSLSDEQWSNMRDKYFYILCGKYSNHR